MRWPHLWRWVLGTSSFPRCSLSWCTSRGALGSVLPRSSAAAIPRAELRRSGGEPPSGASEEVQLWTSGVFLGPGHTRGQFKLGSVSCSGPKDLRM